MSQVEQTKISELNVRYSKNKAHFINENQTRLFFNNYKHGRDGINKDSIRYACLSKACSASITLAKTNHALLESSKVRHNHPPSSDCEVAIEINYCLIREYRILSTIDECKWLFDQLLLNLQVEYSVEEVDEHWTKWEKFADSLRTRKSRDIRKNDQG